VNEDLDIRDLPEDVRRAAGWEIMIVRREGA
jgi:hypothetical protein